jgi:hypothetical protein
MWHNAPAVTQTLNVLANVVWWWWCLVGGRSEDCSFIACATVATSRCILVVTITTTT